MRKYLMFVLCSVAFGCVGGLARASDYDDAHPPLAFAAFRPVSAEKKVCLCGDGEKCDCGPDCVCVRPGDAVGCNGRAAARRAARAAGNAVAVDEATYAVGFEPQQMAILQPAQVVPAQTVAAADPDVCPCCGMKMTAEQKATMKAKQQQAVPVQTVPMTTTYTTVPMYSGGYYGAGDCVGGNCAGGNCGMARGFRIFRR